MPPAAKQPEIVTVGRIVHYVTHDQLHCAAIVVVAGQGGIEDHCELQIFYPLNYRGSVRDHGNHVPFDPTGTIAHSWHWPERDNGLRGFKISEEITSGKPSARIAE